MILVAIPLAIWMALPVIGAAGFVHASETRAGAVAYVLFQIALIASTVGLFWYYRGEGAIIGLPAWPFFQGVAIMVFAGIAALSGWRMRADFLKD